VADEGTQTGGYGVQMTKVNAASSPPRKRRGGYAKSEATRAAILDAALAVFAESGYRAGSLREIAQRVGMSEAGLLHHFKSKSELMMAVLDRRDELAVEITNFNAADGVDRLRGLVRLAAYNASAPGVVELYCTLSAEATSPTHPAHGYFITRYEWTRREVIQAFESVAAEGRLSAATTPTAAAIATISLMDGLQVQWLLDRTVVDMPEELSRFFRGIVTGFDLESLESLLDRKVDLG